MPLVWDSIPEEFSKKLWRPLPNRVEAVIKAEDGIPGIEIFLLWFNCCDNFFAREAILMSPFCSVFS